MLCCSWIQRVVVELTDNCKGHEIWWTPGWRASIQLFAPGGTNHRTTHRSSASEGILLTLMNDVMCARCRTMACKKSVCVDVMIVLGEHPGFWATSVLAGATVRRKAAWLSRTDDGNWAEWTEPCMKRMAVGTRSCSFRRQRGLCEQNVATLDCWHCHWFTHSRSRL